MNIRNFVPNDHIMSTNEIMQTQSVAIQAYMIENEQLQKELKEVYDKLINKDKRIDQLTNNWNKLKATLNCIKDSETILGGEYYVIHSDYIIALEEVLDKMKEIKEGNNENK